MKKIKTFLIIPLVALFIGLLPQRIAFADDGVSPFYVNSFEEFKNFVVNSIGAIDIPEKVYSSSEYNDYMNKYPYFLIYEDNTRIYFIGSYTQFAMTYEQGNQSFSSPVLQCSSNGELGTIIYYKSSKDMYYYSSTSISLDSIQGNVYPTLKLQPVKGNLRVYDTSNDFEIVEEEEEDRPTELPSVGNGILITAPASGSKINKLEYNDKGYLEQVFTLKVQYKPNDKSIFGVNDNQQKLDVIKGISCEMEDSDFDYHIFDESFKWIVKPSKVVDSVSSPYAVAEMKISTVFKELGKKVFTVKSALKVADDSTDITRDIREYTDSISVEFVSDDNYQDGVVINPDGTTGSDGSNSDIYLDGFPSAPGDGASIVDWIKYFGDVILWLITYPFKLLANAFVVLGGYITTMVNTLTDTSKQITGLFTFIPSDILNVTYGFISFTLLYSVVRGVLKLIRGN